LISLVISVGLADNDCYLYQSIASIVCQTKSPPKRGILERKKADAARHEKQLPEKVDRIASNAGLLIVCIGRANEALMVSEDL
jgi:hypothetical protein